MRVRRLGLRRSVGRLWHHIFFRDSTLSPHQRQEQSRPSASETKPLKMADPVDSAPTAPSTAAPTQPPSQPSAENPPSQQSLPIRDAKSASPAQPETQPQAAKDQSQDKGKAAPKDGAAAAPAAAEAAGAPGADKPLSAGELKKKAKAEKAARRAKERQERDGGAGAAGGSAPGAGQRPPNTPKKDAAGGGAPPKGSKAPFARRGSIHATQAGAGAGEQKQKKKEDKNVAVFGHLYGQQRRTTVAGAGKEVHPAVLALGLQMRDYVVCGSSARCVATMLAFKRVCFLRNVALVSREFTDFV